MSCSGIFTTGSDANYHFPARSLLPARSDRQPKSTNSRAAKFEFGPGSANPRLQRSVAGIGDAGPQLAQKKREFPVAKIKRTPPQRRRRAKELCMATCEVCENEYDKAFEVVVAGKRHSFDSFECAIHALAPVCPHCHCRVVGHGVEANGQIFCCVHCARTAGKTQLKDRV
jgi:hypothetical protein